MILLSGWILKNSKNIIENFKNIFYKYSATENFFTDRFKTYNFTETASYVIFDNNFVKIKLPGESSIFTVEAIAILETLKFISSSEIKIANIFSHSLSVLVSLSNYIYTKKNFLI